jgi:hypothetical protein
MRKKDRVPLHDPTRRRLSRVALTAAVAFGLSLLGTGTAFAAPSTTSVTLTAAPAATVGDVVDVGVGLIGAADVFAYEVTISFDPALFSYVDGSVTAPAGGFDTVTEATGSVTLIHTRLGSSPPLAGDIALSLQLTAIGSGSASVTAVSITLVDPEGATATQADAGTATVAIEADNTEPPGGGDPGDTPTPADGSSASGPLAFTGFAMGGALLLVAGVAVGVGVLLVLRRRMAGTR